jgi:hypothetical protein
LSAVSFSASLRREVDVEVVVMVRETRYCKERWYLDKEVLVKEKERGDKDEDEGERLQTVNLLKHVSDGLYEE